MKSIPFMGLFAILFVMATSAATCQNQHVEIQDRLNQLLSTYESWGFSGTVLVARGSTIIFEKGYGYANRETRELNTADTRFDFASVAKTFTGAAVLALEADGLLSVDDTLEHYIGTFPDDRKSAATLHHLATHTAGLAHRRDSELAYGPDRTAYIESMKHAPFESPPGESYRYTNAGSSLLAALVEEISEVPFEQFIRTRFFEPLDLKSARFISETTFGEPGLALGYQDTSQAPAPDMYAEGWGWGFAGSTGITATARDIFRWVDALRHGDLLPLDQHQKMFDDTEEEAYGWHTDREDAGRLRIHKGGGLQAMQSQIRIYPDEDIVIVWAHNNMTQNWRQALNQGITAIALGDPFGPVPGLDEDFVPGTREVPKNGVYTTPNGTMLELSNQEGVPVLGGNGLGATPGPLNAGLNKVWVLFNPEDVSWLNLSHRPDGILTITLEPEGRTLAFSRTNASTAVMLQQPNPDLLPVVRGYAQSLSAKDADALWKASRYQPIQGTNSQEDWTRRMRFLSQRVGPETGLMEEAWVLRSGTWRYWRSFESARGAQVMVRFELTEDGQIAGFGMNPIQRVPEFDEKRLIK